MSHYTAFVTTDPTCLDGEYCDVVILTDEVMGWHNSTDGDGKTTSKPIWESSGPQMYSAPTTVRTDEDHDDAIKDAVGILATAGWHIVGQWEAIATGYCATVERHNQ